MTRLYFFTAFIFYLVLTGCTNVEKNRMDELYSSRNRLSESSSLYLRQHSTNPVNWLPWSAPAFKEARILNKPVLVSIGYSTCHWCHVMEEENFSDMEVSALMNSKIYKCKSRQRGNACC